MQISGFALAYTTTNDYALTPPPSSGLERAGGSSWLQYPSMWLLRSGTACLDPAVLFGHTRNFDQPLVFLRHLNVLTVVVGNTNSFTCTMSGSEIGLCFDLPNEIPCGGTFDLSIHSTTQMPQCSLTLYYEPTHSEPLSSVGGVMRTNQPIQIH